MNSKRKERSSTPASVPKRIGDIDLRGPACESADTRTLLLQAWEEEVTALGSQEFPSMTAAIEAIIAKVGERLGSTDQEREFLTVLMSTDPQVQATLRSVLTIRS